MRSYDVRIKLKPRCMSYKYEFQNNLYAVLPEKRISGDHKQIMRLLTGHNINSYMLDYTNTKIPLLYSRVPKGPTPITGGTTEIE